MKRTELIKGQRMAKRAILMPGLATVLHQQVMTGLAPAARLSGPVFPPSLIPLIRGDERNRGLAAIDKTHAHAVEECVLFGAKIDPLAAPFRHG